MTESQVASVPAGAGETPPQHPLLGFVPEELESGEFTTWLEMWTSTRFKHDKLGLIHLLTLPDCHWWHKPELISVLLETADGHRIGEYEFKTAEEKDRSWNSNPQAAKNRLIIAQKAFSVLCMRFFRKPARGDGIPMWWWMLNNKELFCKVLWFLRQDEKHMRNYSDSDLEYAHSPAERDQLESFRAFLLDFARLAWELEFPRDWKRWEGEALEDIKARLIAARPQFVDVFCATRNLGWLNYQELDRPTVKKLTQVAFGQSLSFPHSEHWGSEFRKPKTLQEAVFGGSVAAQVVVLWPIRKREKARLEKARRENMRRQQALARRAELAELARKRADLEKQTKELAEGKRPK